MRPALRALVILLLAAATTVAVAWAGEVRSGRLKAFEKLSQEASARQAAEREADNRVNPWGRGGVSYIGHPYYGTTRGWPLSALTNEWTAPIANSPPADRPWSFSWERGWEVPNPFYAGGLPSHNRTTTVALQLRPLWPGFAANTLVFAVGWWVLLGGGFFRAALRRRRGLCPRCGYDRAGLAEVAGCPECGEQPKQ